MEETGLVVGALVTRPDLSDFPLGRYGGGRGDHGRNQPLHRHVFYVWELVAGGDGAYTRVCSTCSQTRVSSHEQKIRSNVVTDLSMTHLTGRVIHLMSIRSAQQTSQYWING